MRICVVRRLLHLKRSGGSQHEINLALEWSNTYSDNTIQQLNKQDLSAVADCYNMLDADDSLKAPNLMNWLCQELSTSHDINHKLIILKKQSISSCISPLHMISVLQLLQNIRRLPSESFGELNVSFLQPSFPIIKAIFNNCSRWLEDEAKLDIISVYLQSILRQIVSDGQSQHNNKNNTADVTVLKDDGIESVVLHENDLNNSVTEIVINKLSELRSELTSKRVKKKNSVGSSISKSVSNKYVAMLTSEIYPVLWRIKSEYDHRSHIPVKTICHSVIHLLQVESKLQVAYGYHPQDSPSESLLSSIMKTGISHRGSVVDHLLPAVLLSSSLAPIYSKQIDEYYFHQRYATDLINRTRVLTALVLCGLSSILTSSSFMWWCSHVPLASCLGAIRHSQLKSDTQEMNNRCHFLHAILDVVVTSPEYEVSIPFNDYIKI